MHIDTHKLGEGPWKEPMRGERPEAEAPTHSSRTSVGRMATSAVWDRGQEESKGLQGHCPHLIRSG